MTDIVVSADSLCRSFAHRNALTDVSLSLERGSICSLLGPNGAGKTTLLKLLMGLITPTSGRAGIHGDCHLPRSAATQQNTGCLIDGLEPPSHTQIHHLISLSRSLSPNFDTERCGQLLEIQELLPRQSWNTLSKGHRRWVLLVMLLCRRCELLLLDEPADGLDPETRRTLYELIRQEVNDRNITAVITTHIINDIERVTDDVCILSHGQLVLTDNLECLREQVTVVELESECELAPDIELLAREQTDRTTIWVRDRHGTLPLHFEGEIRRRNAPLEEIYLTMTRAPQAVPPARTVSSTPR